MKKITLIIVLFMLISSCNTRTTTSYNDTIVAAHTKLFEANDQFFKETLNFIGKPESKKELLKLIAATRSKLVEAQKPVELLEPLSRDHGLRKTMLDMFNSSITAMDGFEINIDILTAKDNETKAATMLQGAFTEILELDELIKELQVQYAHENNAQLR
ncbi:hypothetical protein [Flavobacterium fluviale]|uniref:DUF4142 domain-containing protein n=1 Tax=Flavobacterium fluviale TaxID=2249356 RepID=A0A344LPE4_9FLAO|nr:hypothetical protein [Flavobacterium fluviale]AXB55786.1 hypothetical protein HYN86_03880 [Flavobacterium fluviale]